MMRIRKIQNSRKIIRTAIILFLIGLAGSGLLWYATQPWGIGVGYDSFYYITSARNLISGQGLGTIDVDGSIIPLTKFPPLYPLILATLSFTSGLGIIDVARLINIILYGTNVFLVGWLIYYFTKSYIAGTLGSVLFLSSQILMRIHLMVMTEPIFIPQVLLTIFSFSLFVFQRKKRYLILAAVLSTLGFLTRYIGLTLIGFGAFSLLLSGKQPFKNKLKHTTLYILICALVGVPWMVRNWVISGSPTDRKLAIHLPQVEKIVSGMEEISTWLISSKVNTNIRILFFCMFIISILTATLWWWNKAKENQKINSFEQESLVFSIMCWGYIIIYIIFLFISLSLFDASTPINSRILSPVFVVGIILSILLIWRGLQKLESLALSLPIIIIVLAIGLVVYNNFNLERMVVWKHRHRGIGFTGHDWQTSETIEVIEGLKPEGVIYTNESFPVFFLTGRLTLPVPLKYDPINDVVLDDYRTEIRRMHQEIKDEGGIIVLFDTIFNFPDYYSIEELTEGLVLWNETADGLVYSHP